MFPKQLLKLSIFLLQLRFFSHPVMPFRCSLSPVYWSQQNMFPATAHMHAHTHPCQNPVHWLLRLWPNAISLLRPFSISQSGLNALSLMTPYNSLFFMSGAHRLVWHKILQNRRQVSHLCLWSTQASTTYTSGLRHLFGGLNQTEMWDNKKTLYGKIKCSEGKLQWSPLWVSLLWFAAALATPESWC